MDLHPIALAMLMLGALVLGAKVQRHQRPGSPDWQYQRVLSVGFSGLLFFVAGLIGWARRVPPRLTR